MSWTVSTCAGSDSIFFLVDELFQLFKLTIGEGIHRIDDNRTCPGCLTNSPCANDSIDNRQEKAQRLSGPSSRGHDEAFAISGLGNSALLVAVQFDRRSLRASREDFAESGIEHVLSDDLVNRGSCLKTGINSNQRLGPEALVGIGGINLRPDFERTDLRKGTSERFVPLYQSLIEIEDIH